jgi:serine/threonine protein kinase
MNKNNLSTLTGPDKDPQATGRVVSSLILQPSVEAVPGYSLKTRLGRGSFGEVWKAIGPGGVPVAMKFVRLDESGCAAEAHALEFMKFVSHPNLLTVFGIWDTEGFLIIGTELADRTLLQRLCEARSQGLGGIPLTELLDYMSEAAKGVDFLNEPRHTLAGETGVRIIHRDIKPENLLLLGGGIKVADFGLARVLERSIASASGAMTPAYAPPEFFAGSVARQSDQYSLAVTYCQLRGGALPFQGNLYQLIASHLPHLPDLSMLPQEERAIVARALAKAPEERWPTCRTFVQELINCSHSSRLLGVTPPSRQSLDSTTLGYPKVDLIAQDAEAVTQPHQPGTGLQALWSMAKLTDRIFPMVVEGHTERPSIVYYMVRELRALQEDVQLRIRLGSRLFWAIDCDREAHLILLDEAPEGKIYCLCPSWFAPDSHLQPGVTLLPREVAGCEPFALTGVPGRENVYAILTERPLNLDWMPPNSSVPARILTKPDVSQLLTLLNNLEPSGWSVLLTSFDVVV